MLSKLAVQLSVFFGIGKIPFAPGTWGSIPGLFVGAGIFKLAITLFGTLNIPAFCFILALNLLLGIVAYFAIKVTEELWGTHDSSQIVIDEVIGQSIAVSFFIPTWKVMLIGFVLFRFFDILKPGPIGKADRELHGAWGTLLDDVFAGVIAGALLAIIYPVL